jgi:hypothetical protein
MPNRPGGEALIVRIALPYLAIALCLAVTLWLAIGHPS